jgi:hypothetical protein
MMIAGCTLFRCQKFDDRDVMSLSLPQGYGSLHKLSSRSQYRSSYPETIGATESQYPGHLSENGDFGK